MWKRHIHAEEGERDGSDVITFQAHKLNMLNFFRRCIISVESARALLGDKLKYMANKLFYQLSLFFQGDSRCGCCLATVSSSKSPLCLLSAPHLAEREAQSAYHVKAADAHIHCYSMNRYDVMDD